MEITITCYRDNDGAFARITGPDAPRDVSFDSVPYEDSEIAEACGCAPTTTVLFDAIPPKRL